MSQPDCHSPGCPPPKRLIVLHNPQVAAAGGLAAAIEAYLNACGGLSVACASIADAEARSSVAGQDLIITVGGDGSMLRTGTLAAVPGVPILGINLGRLGFLGEVEPTNWREALARVLAGDYWLEERMMLHVEHWRGSECLAQYEALNEAVVSRGVLARPVRLRTLIDGGDLTTYVADGLIVSTPTGSTAYALAAGGPILPPELKNILLIAIAPHLSMDRAIVLAQGVSVTVFARDDHQAILSADGQFERPLADGDQVRARMSAYQTRFARVRPRHYFYTSLMRRMQQNPAADKTKNE
jgi:NAD+ kinase